MRIYGLSRCYLPFYRPMIVFGYWPTTWEILTIKSKLVQQVWSPNGIWVEICALGCLRLIVSRLPQSDTSPKFSAHFYHAKLFASTSFEGLGLLLTNLWSTRRVRIWGSMPTGPSRRQGPCWRMAFFMVGFGNLYEVQIRGKRYPQKHPNTWNTCRYILIKWSWYWKWWW